MKNWVKYLGISLSLVLAGSVMLMAQDPANAGAPQQNASLFELYTKGGIIGYLTTLLSVVAMTVSIQCFLEFKKEKLLPAYFINEIQTCIEEDDIDGAMDACDREDIPLAKIMGHVFSRYDGGAQKMSDAMVEASDEQANNWATKISWLSLIGGIAPMLGLFGTVSGMITAFDTISKSAGTASPEMLAKGIMEALVTTFIGLAVAIPTITCYNILKNKMNSLIIEQANICADLLDKATQE